MLSITQKFKKCKFMIQQSKNGALVSPKMKSYVESPDVDLWRFYSGPSFHFQLYSNGSLTRS